VTHPAVHGFGLDEWTIVGLECTDVLLRLIPGQPPVAVMSRTQRSALRAHVALGDRVVAVALYLHHLVVGHVHDNPAVRNADPAEAANLGHVHRCRHDWPPQGQVQPT
jgi:hypothetical protein